MLLDHVFECKNVVIPVSVVEPELELELELEPVY
jgi:hypothetical protein